MNVLLASDDPSVVTASSPASPPRALSWGALLAGAVAALAAQILLMMLGAGLGLAIYNPLTNDNPVADLGTGAVVIQGLSAVISLWIGGWVAGRATGRAGLRVGSFHGFLVWCLATVVSIGAVTLGAGWALGDMGKIVGQGFAAAGRPLAEAAGAAGGNLAQEAADRNAGMLSSFVDEALGTNSGNEAPAGQAIRDRRDLGLAVARLVTAGPDATASAEQELVQVLSRNQRMSEAQAREMIASWKQAYQQLRQQLDEAAAAAEAKAREIAERNDQTLAALALCTFVAFVIGAVSATLGGRHGGACGYRRSDPLLDASRKA